MQLENNQTELFQRQTELDAFFVDLDAEQNQVIGRQAKVNGHAAPVAGRDQSRTNVVPIAGADEQPQSSTPDLRLAEQFAALQVNQSELREIVEVIVRRQNAVEVKTFTLQPGTEELERASRLLDERWAAFGERQCKFEQQQSELERCHQEIAKVVFNNLRLISLKQMIETNVGRQQLCPREQFSPCLMQRGFTVLFNVPGPEITNAKILGRVRTFCQPGINLGHDFWHPFRHHVTQLQTVGNAPTHSQHLWPH